MSRTLVPLSLSGDLLWGSNAVRFIFLDEAGVSGDRNDVVRVVAAIIVHADKQLLLAEAALANALGAVPAEFKDGFLFHAEDIMNNGKYRDRWRLTDRINLLKSVMALPRRLKLPIAFGLVWALSPPTALAKSELRLPQQQHIEALAYALGKADSWIADHADPEEIGTIVAENSDVKTYIQRLVRNFQGYVFGPNELRAREKDFEQGFNSQNGVIRFSKLRKTIHFVGKDEDNLVWLADGCRYGIKRYFAGADFGDDFCKAIFGQLANKKDFEGPVSGSVFWSV